MVAKILPYNPDSYDQEVGFEENIQDIKCVACGYRASTRGTRECFSRIL